MEGLYLWEGGLPGIVLLPPAIAELLPKDVTVTDEVLGVQERE